MCLLPAVPPPPADEAFVIDSMLASAERFVVQFHSENQAGPPDLRLRQVRREIEATGTYRHTPAELEFGARVAWRNSARCIGRLYWRSLRVRDRREVTAAADVAAESVAHLREATNGGRIRPLITVFAPEAPDRPGPRILNSQLVRYAGYETADGAVTGDPASADLTRLARDLGWAGGRPPGRFDVLPLIVQAPGASSDAARAARGRGARGPIEHPEFALVRRSRAALVRRARDQRHVPGDRRRLLPGRAVQRLVHVHRDRVARLRRRRPLQPAAGDRQLHGPVHGQRPDPVEGQGDHRAEPRGPALVQPRPGVTITDHHTESARFLQHLEREERQGRACPADWTWIVPPAASSATPVFHRYYQDFDQTPNFYRRGS